VLSPQALADKKKGITDEDLLALVGDEVHQAAVVWELVDLQVRGGASRQQQCCVGCEQKQKGTFDWWWLDMAAAGAGGPAGEAASNLA
jgi:hypothetical protein